MLDLKSLSVDPKTFEDGKRIELGDGAYIGVRSTSSIRANKVRERLFKPYANWRQVPDDVLARLNAEWLAEGILTEFHGFAQGGQPIEIDLTKVEDQKRLASLLKQAPYKALRSRILTIAMDEANFQAAEDAAAEEN